MGEEQRCGLHDRVEPPGLVCADCVDATRLASRTIYDHRELVEARAMFRRLYWLAALRRLARVPYALDADPDPGGAVTTCRSCGAPIEWAVSPAGKRLPLDVAFGPGNLLLDQHGVARVVRDGEGTRRSHFASCPNAGQHRRRGPL